MTWRLWNSRPEIIPVVFFSTSRSWIITPQKNKKKQNTIQFSSMRNHVVHTVQSNKTRMRKSNTVTEQNKPITADEWRIYSQERRETGLDYRSVKHLCILSALLLLLYPWERWRLLLWMCDSQSKKKRATYGNNLNDSSFAGQDHLSFYNNST